MIIEWILLGTVICLAGIAWSLPCLMWFLYVNDKESKFTIKEKNI